MANGKLASIIFRACICSDDGRAITGEYQCFLNDHGGIGFWHGGPGFPDHCRTFSTDEDATAYAQGLGYQVVNRASM